MNPIVFKALRRERKVSLIELAGVTGLSCENLAAFELAEASLPLESIEMLRDTVQRWSLVREN